MWVVADIRRAVNDKTAKALLGEHFRRQLMMDGQYGAISFVCTMTDQMMKNEIVRLVDLPVISVNNKDIVCMLVLPYVMSL